MLVLTRKLHERIQIGNDITVTVLRIKGGAVRIGIEAPANTRVLRAELAGAEAQRGTGTGRGAHASGDLVPSVPTERSRSTSRPGGVRPRLPRPDADASSGSRWATGRPQSSVTGERTYALRAPLARFTPRQAALAAVSALSVEAPADSLEALFG